MTSNQACCLTWLCSPRSGLSYRKKTTTRITQVIEEALVTLEDAPGVGVELE